MVSTLPLDTSPRSGRRGEEDRRRELGQEVGGQVEVEIEALEPGESLDLFLREDHAADLVVGVGQGQETLGKDALGP